MHSHFNHTGTRQVSCRLCGRPVDANMAAMRNGVCRAPACEAERTREASRAIQERDWRQYKQATADRLIRASRSIAAISERTGCTLQDIKVQMLPRQTRPMTGPDPDARAAFKDYLREIVDRSFEKTEAPTPSPGRDRQAEPERIVAQAACATCKGDCCNLGGKSNAFLNADVISEFRGLHPEMDADQVYEEYVSRLADVTPEGSCQYHGPLGCTLERFHRADICNLHHCRSLKYLLHLSGVVGDAPVALIALDEDGDGLDATLVKDGAWERIDTTDAPEIGADQADEIIGRGIAWLPEISPMIQPIREPEQARRECKWCGQSITINQASTTESCGAPACERQRMTELAREYAGDE